MTISSRATTAGADVDEHVKRLVDQAPPLGLEQRDRLAVLLRPAGRLLTNAAERSDHLDTDPAR